MKIPQVIMIDANFIIDICEIDKKLLSKIVGAYKKIIIPNVILKEVYNLSENEAEKIGIDIIITEQSLLKTAITEKLKEVSSLSFEDFVFLLLAEQIGLKCVTNDKKLFNECKSRKIDVIWGLELIIEMYKNRVLSKNQALAFVKDMMRINKRITDDVYKQFIAKLT
jgi:rRNA-processing protein FCF1